MSCDCVFENSIAATRGALWWEELHPCRGWSDLRHVTVFPCWMNRTEHSLNGTPVRLTHSLISRSSCLNWWIYDPKPVFLFMGRLLCSLQWSMFALVYICYRANQPNGAEQARFAHVPHKHELRKFPSGGCHEATWSYKRCQEPNQQNTTCVKKVNWYAWHTLF